jgi:RNA polymerase sigma factor (sigma-70 family)
MATNTCLNRLRQRKKQGISSHDPETLSLAEHDPEFARLEARVLMDALLESESERTKAICFMYYWDGMTMKEIGELVGLSISGVRKQLSAFYERAKLKGGGSDNE